MAQINHLYQRIPPTPPLYPYPPEESGQGNVGTRASKLEVDQEVFYRVTAIPLAPRARPPGSQNIRGSNPAPPPLLVAIGPAARGADGLRGEAPSQQWSHLESSPGISRPRWLPSPTLSSLLSPTFEGVWGWASRSRKKLNGAWVGGRLGTFRQGQESQLYPLSGQKLFM